MFEELEKLKNHGVNISYPSEEMIQDLEIELSENENIEVNLYYKLIDLKDYLKVPDIENLEPEERMYPIYIDYATLEEIKNDNSIIDDLKKLNVVRVKVREALEIFKYQEKVVKKE